MAKNNIYNFFNDTLLQLELLNDPSLTGEQLKKETDKANALIVFGQMQNQKARVATEAMRENSPHYKIKYI